MGHNTIATCLSCAACSHATLVDNEERTLDGNAESITCRYFINELGIPCGGEPESCLTLSLRVGGNYVTQTDTRSLLSDEAVIPTTGVI